MISIQDIINKIHCADSTLFLKTVPSNSIDLMATDPPYGYSFMGKDWDKAVPSVSIWQECLRVLKPGAFAFVMSSPRQDVLSQMIVRLSQAGFNTNFSSIYWAYASGFPKSTNISKAIDKRLGLEREIIGTKQHSNNFENALTNKIGYLQDNANRNNTKCFGYGEEKITIPVSEQAKSLDGSYAGCQLKPAVEIIIVAMKPIEEKTYIDQAMKNSHGITYLDNCRIPINPEIDDMLRETTRIKRDAVTWDKGSGFKNEQNSLTGVREDGRFPANLLVSDDILNSGKVTESSKVDPLSFPPTGSKGIYGSYEYNIQERGYEDSGQFSRYFSLDAWFDARLKKLPLDVQKVFPFLIVPKASGSERDEGLDNFDNVSKFTPLNTKGGTSVRMDGAPNPIVKNNHPTVKPLKLFSYLIELGSRPEEIVLDPFCGSGTTPLACSLLSRKFIAIDISQEYYNIAIAKLQPFFDKDKFSEMLAEADKLPEISKNTEQNEEDLFL